jgi:hypothetical protein
MIMVLGFRELTPTPKNTPGFSFCQNGKFSSTTSLRNRRVVPGRQSRPRFRPASVLQSGVGYSTSNTNTAFVL